MRIRQIHAQNRCALALAVAIPLRFFNWDLRANAGRGICMSIGRDSAAAGIEDSRRAYVKIKRYKCAPLLGRSVKSALNSIRDLLLRAQCGKVPQICFLRGGHSFAR